MGIAITNKLDRRVYPRRLIPAGELEYGDREGKTHARGRE